MSSGVTISFSVPADGVSHKMEFEDGSPVDVVREKVRTDLGISPRTKIKLIYAGKELIGGTLAESAITSAAESKEAIVYEVIIKTEEVSSGEERGGGGLPSSIEVPARGPGQFFWLKTSSTYIKAEKSIAVLIILSYDMRSWRNSYGHTEYRKR